MVPSRSIPGPTTVQAPVRQNRQHKSSISPADQVQATLVYGGGHKGSYPAATREVVLTEHTALPCEHPEWPGDDAGATGRAVVFRRHYTAHSPPAKVSTVFTNVAAQSWQRTAQVNRHISPRRQPWSPQCEQGDTATARRDMNHCRRCAVCTTDALTKLSQNDACRVAPNLCALPYIRYGARITLNRHWERCTVSSTLGEYAVLCIGWHIGHNLVS